MKLKEVLKAVKEDWKVGAGRRNPEISSLVCDSRQVSTGALFFAIRGSSVDGADFIPEAVKKGAAAIICETPLSTKISIPWIQVKSIRKVMAGCAAHFHNYPSRQIRLTGVTGTNGKTTIAHILESIFSQEGPSLLLGTVQTSIGGSREDAGLTTPESTDLHRLFARAVQAGVERGAMEVSSHSLAMDRVFGISFPEAVFTNLTADHLDFHRDIEEYFQTKSLLFDPSFNQGLLHSVINIDDPFGARLAGKAGGRIISYGMNPAADLSPLELHSDIEGTRMILRTPWGKFSLHSRLCGRHNIYNLMAGVGAALAQGIPPEQAAKGIEKLESVPGRFQKLALDTSFSVILDYAHTPDALQNVLDLARAVCRGRVIVLFGCGGDRDRTKRPEMARIGVANSDIALITSDNPRSEDPGKIIEDMVAGIPKGTRSKKWEVIVDRKEAIARALSIADKGDLVLLAGKGHEDYQVISTGKIPFNEETIVKEILCSG